MFISSVLGPGSNKTLTRLVTLQQSYQTPCNHALGQTDIEVNIIHNSILPKHNKSPFPFSLGLTL